MKQRILVIFGGCSGEHEVSLDSARAVLAHMDPARFTPLPVKITREGRWRYCPLTDLSAEDWHETGCVPCTLSLDRGAPALLLENGLRRLSFDAAFPVLHGPNGEDGTLQGLLELAGIPVIGCGALASALGMDKHRAHLLASLAGVRVPRSQVFPRGAGLPEARQAAASLGWPVFVKPVRSGSSLGVSEVRGPEELPAALEAAFAEDREALVEEAVPGFEVGCAILGNRVLTCGAVDEIQLGKGPLDYREKYLCRTAQVFCPARIPPEKAAEIQAAGRAVYRALDCRVFARVDFFLTPEGDVVFNEINTIPGFTVHSRYPDMMKAAGLDFQTLVTRLIELGVEA